MSFLNGTDPGLRQTKVPVVDTYTAGSGFTAGSTTALTLSADPGNETACEVSFDGILQHGSTFTHSGTTLTFSSAIPTGVTEVQVRHAAAIPATTPADGSVTSAKLASGSVSVGKLSTTGTPSATTFLNGSMAWAAVSAGFTLGTEVATTSGTTADITGIPSGTKQIIVTFEGLSWSATWSSPKIVLGDAGGFETSGYVGAGGQTASATASSRTDSFALADTSRVAAADTLHGSIHLTLSDAANFTWVCTGMVGPGEPDCVLFVTGSKSLSAELTQIRISTVEGNTFDAGAINVQYIS